MNFEYQFETLVEVGNPWQVCSSLICKLSQVLMKLCTHLIFITAGDKFLGKKFISVMEIKEKSRNLEKGVERSKGSL